jgi:hypothetical protein
MRFTGYSFGSIQVDGMTYDHDLIIDRGKIRKPKRPPRAGSAVRTGTPRCRPLRTSRGGAGDW